MGLCAAAAVGIVEGLPAWSTCSGYPGATVAPVVHLLHTKNFDFFRTGQITPDNIREGSIMSERLPVGDRGTPIPAAVGVVVCIWSVMPSA